MIILHSRILDNTAKAAVNILINETIRPNNWIITLLHLFFPVSFSFQEFLFFLLPLVNFRRLKSSLSSYFLPRSNRRPTLPHMRTPADLTVCVICNQWPNNAHEIGCSHVFCYYCITVSFTIHKFLKNNCQEFKRRLVKCFIYIKLVQYYNKIISIFLFRSCDSFIFLLYLDFKSNAGNGKKIVIKIYSWHKKGSVNIDLIRT